jgi:hypothetical protein
MGYWNNGILEYWVWRNVIYFNIDDTDQKLKSGHHPLFIPNIPIFSPRRRLYEPEATIPIFHWLSNGKHHPFGVKSKPGPPSLRAVGSTLRPVSPTGWKPGCRPYGPEAGPGFFTFSDLGTS